MEGHLAGRKDCHMRRIGRARAVAAAMLAGIGTAAPAFAADNAMKVCGAKYQAAKTAKTLPAGQTWGQYLAQCRASLPKPAAVTTPATSMRRYADAN